MSLAFLNLIANYAGTQITHIGLLRPNNEELSSFYYARQPVSWGAAAGGVIRPTANVEFVVVAGDEIRYWACFTSATGGSPLLPSAVPLFAPAALYIYRLQPTSTGVGFSVIGG